MKRGDKDTEYVLFLSYGKDSTACLGAIEHLGWPLDRIVTADIWATDRIPAEYLPVVEYKKMVDRLIKERYGITVEHFCATRVDGVEKDKVTYSDGFFHVLQSGNRAGEIKGFPMQRGPWCQKLKLDVAKQADATKSKPKMIQYLGIAADEEKRIAIHKNRPDIRLPLVELGWEEDLCGLWCKYSGLLSPTYTESERDGCWFCHNQGVNQLRRLRHQYPDLWGLLLEWDAVSPNTFKAPSRKQPGKTVHDYEKRFSLEDEGLIDPQAPFRWESLDKPIQLTLFSLERSTS